MDTQKLMIKVAEVAPEAFNFLMETAEEVKQSPFRDEIVGELNGLIKKASFGSAAQRVAIGLGSSIGASVALSLAGDAYDAVKRGITKNRNYKAMLEENPDLREHPAKEVQRTFSTLHRFNPEFSSDPTVAGSFVRNQLQLPSMDVNSLVQLVNARKNLKDTRSLPNMGRVPWESEDEEKKTKWEARRNKAQTEESILKTRDDKGNKLKGLGK